MSNVKRICLNKSVLDFMEQELTPSSTVLEFGGGWSSRWFADRCGKLVVIETSFKWADKIKGELGGRGRILIPRVGLYFITDLNSMHLGIGEADLVLIDCSEGLRHAAAIFAWPLVKRFGWLLFDDAQRRQHANTVAWLIIEGGVPVELHWQPGDVESAKERVTLAWQKT